MKAKIAIGGSGTWSSALRRGLERAGHEDCGPSATTPRPCTTPARGRKIVLLAVPFSAIDAAMEALSEDTDGKPLVDATNALTGETRLALGCTTSGAEELQKKAPRAKVVKAFNTVFAGAMESGRVGGEQLTAFAAGDDKDARQQVLELARDIGFDAVDAGPLENARWLETLGFFNIQLGYVLGMGTDIGFRLVH